MASVDSTTAFVRATGRFLHGEGFPRLGTIPRQLARVLPLLNRLPRPVTQSLYRKSRAIEAIPPADLVDVDVDAFREWVGDRYPQRRYPAVVIGAPNGAAVHLAALLGVPYLPQTFLIPVARSVPAGDGVADLEWGRAPGEALLNANPDVQLHHMHDPNRDRLALGDVAAFRVKIRRLGGPYRRFLAETLASDGTIFLIDCRSRWPTTRVGDRHVFQFGCFGDVRPEEYLYGSERVDRYLAGRADAPDRWDPPAPNEQSPEAEWGFERALRNDVVEVADRHDWDVQTLATEDPQDLSDLVADLYRNRYAERGSGDDRLLVHQGPLLDPWWTMRTGSVPYWLPFDAVQAADDLEDYLARSAPVDEIYLTLFSNGVEAVGQAPIARWRRLLDSAETRGAFLGVDTDAYPLDFAAYVRYHSAIPETIPDREPLLPPLSVEEFERFLDDRAGRHPID